MSLFAAFESRFPADRNRPFIEEDSGRTLSYADLDDRSARYARILHDAGASPGDVIAVQTEKSAEAVMLYLGCLRAGFVYLPLNTAYTDSELDYFLGDAAPVVVITDPARADGTAKRAAAHGAETVLTLDGDGHGSARDAADIAGGDTPTAALASDSPAAILYSSGTTGRPKGAVLTQGNLTANAQALHAAWGFGPDDVLLHVLPIFHTHGLFVALNTVLMNGTGMIFQQRFDPQAVLAALPRTTVFMGVPTYYTRLLKEQALTPALCANMRLFLSGSAPLMDETFKAFAKRSGHTIVERYGMTETGILTSARLDKPRAAGTVGWPLTDVELRITNDGDAPVPTGVTGNVQVRGPNVFAGYRNMPDKTAESFTGDNWFRTGDLGHVDDSGQLTLVGRAKDMFISGGFNVFPKEIEDVLDARADVAESAVLGMPHSDFGEAGLAVVVPSGSGNPDPGQIRAHLKAELANYKVPKLVVIADTLPRNAMGKVQKTVLRKTYEEAWVAAIGD